MTIKFDILNRFTDEVIYTAEIDCADDVPFPVKKGLAVKQAAKDGADLIGANLTNANLSKADLSYAWLADADLVGADLSYADLRYANLYDAILRNADLTGVIRR